MADLSPNDRRLHEAHLLAIREDIDFHEALERLDAEAIQRESATAPVPDTTADVLRCWCGLHLIPSDRPFDRDGSLRCPASLRGEPGHFAYITDPREEVPGA